MRSDWDITREETNRKFFDDAPSVTEVLRVRFTLTHRDSGTVIVREENFTTPSETDLVRLENVVLDRFDKALAETPNVQLGSIDTRPRDDRTPEQKKADAVALALSNAEQARRNRDALDANVQNLKALFPDDSAAIDTAVAAVKQANDALAASALEALKNAESAGDVVAVDVRV